MMIRFENPTQFDTNKKVGDVEITYFDLMEISQGSPEIGKFSINGKMMEGYYGGPAICEDKYVYAPIYVKKLFRAGFKIAKINLETFEIEHLGKIKDLIFLDKVDGNRICFYEDLNKTIERHYQI